MDKTLTLEEQYAQIIKGLPDVAPEETNLEQPSVWRVVPTVTTYSVSQKPEPIQS